jgi:hypothetical protein
LNYTKFLVLPLLLLLQPGFAEKRESISERIEQIKEKRKSIVEKIELIEEERGVHFKKRHFQPILAGDFLFWKADVDGVATAVTFVREGDAATRVKTRTPHFAYDPGFRLGAGVQSPYGLYDLFLVWTRFDTEGSDQAHGSLITGSGVSGDKFIADLIGMIRQLVSVPDKFISRCGIRENLLDLQLARGIQASRHFFMRSYFGVRGVLSGIDWKMKAKRDFLLSDLDQDSSKLHVRNDFRGLGGLIGLELDWKAPMGFGVNMRGAGALLWGPSKEETKQRYAFVPAGGLDEINQTYRAENSFHSLKAMWEMFLGVFWETDFTSEKAHKKSLIRDKEKQRTSLRLLVGYELQEWPWFGQKTNVQATRERDRFTLGFQGLTANAKIVF